MSATLFCVLVLTCLASVRADGQSKLTPEHTELDDRIRAVVNEMLDRQASLYDTRIAQLENQLLSQNRKIQTLVARGKRHQKLLKGLARDINQFVQNGINQRKGNDIKRQIMDENVNSSKMSLLHSNGPLDKNMNPDTNTRMNSDGRPRSRAIQASANVAFSAYLDHGIQHMTDGFKVNFNRVHLNDGDGYDHYTGVFTAPVSGVYLFTYHWNSHYQPTVLDLMVDGVKMASGIVWPVSNTEAMGGQTVLFRIHSGQTVWIENSGAPNGEIFIASSQQFATFAGILMY